MKKIFTSVVAALTILIFPATAFAASGRVVSGPSGPGANGWFSAQPTYVVDTVPGCSTGPHTFTVGSWGGEGVHHITLRSYDNNHPTLDQLDDHNGTGTNAATWTCPDSGPASSGDPVIFYEGDIKWDATAPTISISSPGNNTNTDSASVKLSGSVGDKTSGVWKVIVNGVAGSVSGGGFSATVPLNNGLNTLTATVYDYAGNTAQAQIVVNRITSCGGSCSAGSASSDKPTASSGNTSQQAGDNATANNSNDTGDKSTTENTKAEDENSTPTIVKGVVQNGGIGLATILGFVVVLLILDRFRIIEVKAFSRITDRLSTSKKKPSKATKKSS